MILATRTVLLLVLAALRDGPSPLPDPHRHANDVNASWAVDNPDEGFTLTRTPRLPAESELDERATSPGRRYEAFATCDGGCRVLVRSMPGGIHDLRSPLFSDLRPFSGLVWLTPHLLVFDQWTQPHYGIHYVVDMRTRRLLRAAPFTDNPDVK